MHSPAHEERLRKRRELMKRHKPPDGFFLKLWEKFNRDVTVAFKPSIRKYVLMTRNFNPHKPQEWDELRIWQTDEGGDLPLDDYGIWYMRQRVCHVDEQERDDAEVDRICRDLKTATDEKAKADMQYIFKQNKSRLFPTTYRRKHHDPRYWPQRWTDPLAE